MPRRTATAGLIKADPPRKKAPPKIKKIEPLPPGLILTDLTKKQWKLGKSIGVGGFGEIHLATDRVNDNAGPDSSYVVKIEPHTNGPLFTEIHCLHRIGKRDSIQEWILSKKLNSLGMPLLYGSGSFMYKGERHRFMVMERYGIDIHKLFEEQRRKLSLQTVFNIGIKVLNVLEYIHSNGYIHADIKGSNLLLGYKKGSENEVYLVDYGLACKYETQGKHKEYKPDQRFAHDGTIEYTSRDAHIGVHSRRGDLEILGYNMLQWLCGRLPWEDNLHDPEYVKMQKEGFMKNIPSLMRNCFGHQDHPVISTHHSCCDDYPGALSKYFEYINNMGFEMKPDYYYCRQLFKHGLKESGITDTDTVFPGIVPKRGVKRRSLTEEGENQNVPKKIERPSKSRKPLNSFRNLRNNTSSNEQETKKPVKKGRKKNFIDTSLDNPTPAMMEMLKQRQSSQMSNSDSKKNSRSSGSKPSEDESVNNLTPAMLEVIRKREERLSSLGCDESSIDQNDMPLRGRTLPNRNDSKSYNASLNRSKTATKQEADKIKKKYVKGRLSMLSTGRKSLVNAKAINDKVAKRVVKKVARKKVDRKSMGTQTSPGVVLRSGKYKNSSPELF